jgi:hypothetical protein
MLFDDPNALGSENLRFLWQNSVTEIIGNSSDPSQTTRLILAQSYSLWTMVYFFGASPVL